MTDSSAPGTASRTGAMPPSSKPGIASPRNRNTPNSVSAKPKSSSSPSAGVVHSLPTTRNNSIDGSSRFSGPQNMSYPTNKRYDNQVNHEEIVKETHRINIDYNPISGRKMLNTYEIVRELGRGEHGKVKLGYDRERNIYAAIKLLNRKEKPRLGRPQGSSTEEKIHREIAILKKCMHPNIVRLLEVLDDESSRKIYLVLEYCVKGEIRWQNSRGEPVLTRQQTRSVAQNVALGLEYLHLNGIIHRDIKPANLLVSQDDMVKISDFGVSYAVTQEGDLASELELSKTVGTPAFFSPELCIPTEFYDNGERKTPHINEKVDVWAFGVTLYCFLYGDLPFEADNEYELFKVIAHDDVEFPNAPSDDEDLVLANDLIRKLLTKDPNSRPTMTDIKQHPWMLKDMSSNQRRDFIRSTENKTIDVSNEEVNEAIRGASFRTRIKQGFSKFVDQIRPSKNTSSSNNSSASSSHSTALSSLGSNTNNKKEVKYDSKAAPSSRNSPPQDRRLRSYIKHQLQNGSHSQQPPHHHSARPTGTNHQSSDSSVLSNDTDTSNGSLKSHSTPSVITNQNNYTSRSPPNSASNGPFASSPRTRAKTPETSRSGVTNTYQSPQLYNNPTRGTVSDSHVTTLPNFNDGSNLSLNSMVSVISSSDSNGASNGASSDEAAIASFGLMPMRLPDDNSLTSDSKLPSLENLKFDSTVNSYGQSNGSSHLLPELEIPRLDETNVFGEDVSESSSSSSSDDDDGGELTLVIGRNRSRSNDGGNGREAFKGPSSQ